MFMLIHKYIPKEIFDLAITPIFKINWQFDFNFIHPKTEELNVIFGKFRSMFIEGNSFFDDREGEGIEGSMNTDIIGRLLMVLVVVD